MKFLTSLKTWIKQPTTMTAVAVAVAGSVYWITGSETVAAVAASVVLGTVSDNTKALLLKIEALEDAVKSAKVK